MEEDGQAVGSRPVDRPWSVVDFVLIWLGGFLTSSVFFTVAFALRLENRGMLPVLGLVFQYTGWLGLFWLLRRQRSQAVGFDVQPGDVLYLGIGFFLQIVLALALSPLARLLLPDGAPPQEVTEALAEIDTPIAKMMAVLAAGVVTPITEELLHRGVLLKAIAHRSRRFVMVVTAAVFVLVHVTGLDPERPLASAAVVLPPIFLLGLVLAWVTLRRERLGPAIFIHSGWNLLAVLVLFLPQELLESPPI